MGPITLETDTEPHTSAYLHTGARGCRRATHTLGKRTRLGLALPNTKIEPAQRLEDQSLFLQGPLFRFYVCFWTCSAKAQPSPPPPPGLVPGLGVCWRASRGPDVGVELAWKSRNMDFAMPYLIQAGQMGMSLRPPPPAPAQKKERVVFLLGFENHQKGAPEKSHWSPVRDPHIVPGFKSFGAVLESKKGTLSKKQPNREFQGEPQDCFGSYWLPCAVHIDIWCKSFGANQFTQLKHQLIAKAFRETWSAQGRP